MKFSAHGLLLQQPEFQKKITAHEIHYSSADYCPWLFKR